MKFKFGYFFMDFFILKGEFFSKHFYFLLNKKFFLIVTLQSNRFFKNKIEKN